MGQNLAYSSSCTILRNSRRSSLNDVVVDDEVNASGFAVLRGDAKEQLNEEHAVLLRTVDPGHHIAVSGESASDVVLHVLARRHDAPLVAAQHPISTDARVEGHDTR